jgi:hypothetical protein
MASKIGIKIANGEFYPLLEENSLIKKRMILTTAHNNQPSVQIDLYRSAENVMSDAQYIGSLVVDNIKPKPKEEPSIELVISSDENGEIIADAVDLDTGSGGEHHVLNVSLKSLDETSRDMKLPHFELDTNEETSASLYQNASKIRQKKSRRSLTWLFVLIGLLLILGLLAAWLFFLGGLDTVYPRIRGAMQNIHQEQPLAAAGQNTLAAPVSVREPEPASEPVSQPVAEPEPVQQIEEPVPVIQAPAEPPAPRVQTSSRRPPPPVASFNVPEVIPREGVVYRIRWGDTLWDISEAFYRDPWLYTRIARHNDIRNPNYIISGRNIRIPPRN